jgi:hypothetical protein
MRYSLQLIEITNYAHQVRLHGLELLCYSSVWLVQHIFATSEAARSMLSTSMLRRVAIVRTDVSEESIASIILSYYLVFLRTVIWLLVIGNVIPSSPIVLT